MASSVPPVLPSCGIISVDTPQDGHVVAVASKRKPVVPFRRASVPRLKISNAARDGTDGVARAHARPVCALEVGHKTAIVSLDGS